MVNVTAAQFDEAFERGEGFDVLDLQAATVRMPASRKRAVRCRRTGRANG